MNPAPVAVGKSVNQYILIICPEFGVHYSLYFPLDFEARSV